MSRIRLFFVIGPTNAGKGCLLETAHRLDPVGVGLVEVGKMMRAKYLDPASPFYDPDHFKGQAAPTHTAKEAWQMMVDGIGANSAKHTIFIDGQPRDVEQCEMILRDYVRGSCYDAAFVHVYAPEYIRRERAEARDAGDEAKLALSRTRLQGDLIKLYEVLTRLINAGSTVHTILNDGQYPMSRYADMILHHEAALDPRIRSERLWRQDAEL